jgi:ADP-ribose pyrophosphatase
VSFKTLSSEYISGHPYFTARKDTYETPAGKIVSPYFVVELPVSVTAMAITQNNEVILVEQYRHPLQQRLLELPGGFVDKDETPETAVERELMEETGYRFTAIHSLGITAANPGVLNNYTHLFLATGGVKTAAQSLDANEEIEIILKPLDEVRQMLDENQVVQAMHALCLFYGFAFLSK